METAEIPGRTRAVREIRRWALEAIAKGNASPVKAIEERFGLSRAAASRHLAALVDASLLAASGKTKARRYGLKPTLDFELELEVSKGLAEDTVWIEEISELLVSLPSNVLSICEHGFTEMLNNVIDHSASTVARIMVRTTAIGVEIFVADAGVGIFKKISSELQLENEQHAILELAKGRVTTDPANHSGEGIFFTSRMFDQFSIDSGRLFFGSQLEEASEHDRFDALFEDVFDSPGTIVRMMIRLDSKTTARSVFDEYTADFEEFGFSRTKIPVSLLRHQGENLVSRSQAKRLLARTDRFTEVILDFEGVETVGQAFADQIFRVFANAHPEVHLVPIGMTEAVAQMVSRARSNG